MIHNTNLTRAGWNQTIGDSKNLDRTSFIIPYHSFSCPHCLSYQNRILSLDEVMEKIGDTAIDSQGDLLHPNCKCTLSIYWDSSQKQATRYTEEESKELYKLRQKVNTLTLEKSNLRTDMKIYKDLGDEASVDKCRQRINAINRTIRGIKKDLPTDELKTQITAIYR
jgi:two-component SAPR family response regulator